MLRGNQLKNSRRNTLLEDELFSRVGGGVMDTVFGK
jgi:hypothetical protein